MSPAAFFATATELMKLHARHLEKDQPPTDVFWAMTAYDAQGYPHARFALGDRDPLAEGGDGALLYVLAPSPGDEAAASWLPAAPYALHQSMRLRAPRRAILDGARSPPSLRRAP